MTSKSEKRNEAAKKRLGKGIPMYTVVFTIITDNDNELKDEFADTLSFVLLKDYSEIDCTESKVSVKFNYKNSTSLKKSLTRIKEYSKEKDIEINSMIIENEYGEVSEKYL